MIPSGIRWSYAKPHLLNALNLHAHKVNGSISRSSPCNISLSRVQHAVPRRTYETLHTRDDDHVFIVKLNRKERANAMNSTFWREIEDCFTRLSELNKDVRAIVLAGDGAHFSTGLDLKDNPLIDLQKDRTPSTADPARKAFHYHKMLKDMQNSFLCLERCTVPIVVAVHGACVGAGVDLITACDIRIAAEDAIFSVREVKVGLAADMGTLQRFPKIVASDSWVREVCFTGREFGAKEAKEVGLISKLVPGSSECVFLEALNIAREIATLSPVAVAATKASLNFSRDHTIEEGLEHVALLNCAALQTEDIRLSGSAATSENHAQSPFLKL